MSTVKHRSGGDLVNVHYDDVRDLLNAVAIRPAGSDYATRSRMRFYDWLVSL